MVLIPPYIDVDGMIVPLDACVPHRGEPGGVRIRYDLDRPLLQALIYATGSIMARASAEQTAALLAERKRLPTSDQLNVSAITEDFEDYAGAVKNWERLSGHVTDLNDAYFLGGSMTESLAVPRATLAKLMARLYELDAAVAEGRMEAKIDDSILLPPPLPERRETPAPRWEDDEIPVLEQSLRELDELDPLTDAMTDADVDEAARKRRPGIFRLIEHSWEITHDGVEDMPARYRQLGLPLLQAYSRATDELYAYLHDPERIAIARKLPPHSPFRADVSVDLFRHPEPARPTEYSRHVWLAHAEAAFVRARRFGDQNGGDMFTRIGKYTVRMRYRCELRKISSLWRVELA